MKKKIYLCNKRTVDITVTINFFNSNTGLIVKKNIPVPKKSPSGCIDIDNMKILYISLKEKKLGAKMEPLDYNEINPSRPSKLCANYYDNAKYSYESKSKGKIVINVVATEMTDIGKK